MKCSICQNKDATSYTRIEAHHELFEEIKKLNPDRRYNAKKPYYCDVCVKRAEENFKQLQSLMMTNQNATVASVSDNPASISE